MSSLNGQLHLHAFCENTLAQFKKYFTCTTKFIWSKVPVGRAFALSICLLLIFAGKSHAGDGLQHYSDRIKGATTIATLSENSLGDETSLLTGATKFRYTDVSVPTNSELVITIGRKLDMNAPKFKTGANADYQISDDYNGASPAREPIKEVFGLYWDIDIPYMAGTFDQRKGWTTKIAPDSYYGDGSQSRCSTGGFVPPDSVGIWPNYTAYFKPKDYWSGININVPGAGEETLLALNNAPQIGADGVAYYGSTKSNWKVSCTSTIKNGTGEGFKVLMPNGVKYTFDWMVKLRRPSIVGGPTSSISYDPGSCSPSGCNGSLVSSNSASASLITRDEVFLYVSRVEDRFGNWLAYNYDAQNPERLLSIQSNDGVSVALNYTAAGKIQSVVSAGRTWTYNYQQITYAPANSFRLMDVTLPDGSKWSYKTDDTYTNPYSPHYMDRQSIDLYKSCVLKPADMLSTQPIGTGDSLSIDVTHPSGLTGKFKFRKLIHGTNKTPGSCSAVFTAGRARLDGPAKAYQATSLYQKTLSGPGTPNATWSYDYFPTWSYASECIGSNVCASTSQTLVTKPDGVKTRYVFGNDYSVNAGQLLEVSEEESGTVKSKNIHTYLASASGQVFPDQFGIDPQESNNPFASKNRPKVINQLQLQNVNFTTTINGFNNFLNPTSITKSSSLGDSRTDTITYENNLSKWVLGQVKTVTNSNTGKVVSDTTYNANAQPVASSSFGLPQGSTTYNADGTIATMKDAKNNTTTLSNYYRGVPRNIGFADGTSLSAVVNDNGWVTSVTDQLGSTTSYEYDSMGRMTKTHFPTGDTNAWAPMNYWFRPLANGVWAHSVWDDRYAKETQYDALWRPVLQSEWDWADGNTVRRKVWRYDSSGRQAFESYPFKESTDFNALPGTRTEYDALGRVTKVKQDSELGVLTTSTDYLPGFQTKTTNPKGVVTRQGYQVFDAPDTSRPVFTVYAEGTPESKVHDVARDVFGNVFAHAMRDAANTYTKHQWTVRDANMRVCKTTTPEGGATHYEYDANGNVIRMAEGDHTYTNTSTCDAHNIALSEKTITTYDAMNRVTSIDVPGGANGDKAYGYEADGLVSYINNTSNNQATVNRYAYNKRRLLTGESSEQTGWYVWGMGYAYNNNAALSRITYPTSFYVDYAPNGLGQATQAASVHGNWANNVQYYPNGAVKQFTYGNGIVHTMYQNARQLPSATTAKLGNQSIQENHHVFDANGNVSIIGDPANGERNWRSMQYDALDRLTQVHSPNNFGVANYQYDALDNLKRSTLGAAGFTYHYDTNNRIQRVDRDGGGSYNYTHDARGNITNDGRHALFSYDRANRLFDVSGVEGYRYDGNNRRVLAWAPVGGSIISLYGQNGQLFYQQNDREVQNYEYIYLGDDLVATRNFVGNVVKTKYQHTDALGSPVATTDEAGNVVERTEYAPYGAPLNRPVSGVGYTGHVMDSTTGLVYAQQRYYDPMIGRFLSTDPMMADPNNGWNFNRYNYAANNPYKYTDPDGRWVEDVFIGIPSLILGAKSLSDNVKAGNYGSAAVDVLGIVADGAAIVTPAVPGVAGISIKAGRSADKVLDANKADDAAKVFSKEKQALVDMAKADKKSGVTSEDMQAYKDLNKELPDPFPTNKVRGPEAHDKGAPSSQSPHGHVGPVNHIPVKDKP
jgi:RHS repeat-associated protein